MLLGLSDPNEKIEKKCKEILGIFLDLLKIKIIKYEDYLNSDGYIYIPEVYILYLIIFFIFNDNINTYYQQNYNNKYQNNKYFMNIFGTYLKEIKKKFGFVDSTFLLKVLNEMKKLDCKNIKKIKCLDKENVFLNYEINAEIEKNNDEEDNDNNKDKISVDFNKVKNSVIDNIMSMIYSDFLSDKKRTDNNGNGIQPQIPNILTGKDKEFKDNFNILNSSKKTKEKYNYKDNKKFSFNEYFKEENEDENY